MFNFFSLIIFHSHTFPARRTPISLQIQSLFHIIFSTDSPYHDVSGLPDPYLEQMEDEKPPQHMSLSYEESLESGYSTPNSRTRRVIREIIV